MKGKAMAYVLMAMAFSGAPPSVDVDNIAAIPPDKPIPKGCKEYFFNKNGGFRTDKIRRDECVFICVAANDKSAIKKFKKWELLNQK